MPWQQISNWDPALPIFATLRFAKKKQYRQLGDFPRNYSISNFQTIEIPDIFNCYITLIVLGLISLLNLLTQSRFKMQCQEVYNVSSIILLSTLKGHNMVFLSIIISLEIHYKEYISLISLFSILRELQSFI